MPVAIPLIGKRVAVKVIRHELCRSAEAVERFVQEACAANEIGHPNLVDVFNFGTLPDGRSYFVMEWLQGRTLADILDTDGPLPLGAAARALCEICDGLYAAHEASIIHRDLKPQNVFFVDGGRVKLLDFGIAKLVNKRDGSTPNTHPA
jgi:serine/threonine-protein kinase